MSMSRAAAAERIRADQRFWRALVDEVGRDRMDEPGPMGEWTFKDLAAHLAGWRERRIGELEAVAAGRPRPPLPWPAELDGDDERVNDWLHERDRDRPLEDALADYDRSFELLATAIEALPEDIAGDPDYFAWTGGVPITDIDFTDHLHEEHLPAIRAWLEATSGAG
jgi:hypothetical protein